MSNREMHTSRHVRPRRLADTLSHVPWALAVVGLSVLAGVFALALSLNPADPTMYGATHPPVPPTGPALPPVGDDPTPEVVPGTPGPTFGATVSPPAGSGAASGGGGPGAASGGGDPVDRPDTLPPGGGVPTTAGPQVPRGPVVTSGPVVTRAPTPTTVPTTATTAAPPPGAVSGRYRVIGSYVDSFIGEVLVTNASDRPVDWTVRLRFGPSTTGVITYWVESAPQATLARQGTDLTFTSTARVPASSSVPLRFHLSRSGTGDAPLVCTANGSTCR